MNFLLQILGIVDTPNIAVAWVWPAIAAATAIGGMIMNKRSTDKANRKNAQLQKQFAREGIRWKVRDARAAGVSPEFALGAQPVSAAPSYTPDNSGSMIADAGQNISRAALASASEPDREMAKALQAETLRGMKLDNDIKMTQGMSRAGFAQNPPFPHPRGNVIEGQGNSPVKDVPLERTGMSNTRPDSEGGSIPSVGWAKTEDGGLRPVPSQDIKNRIEDQLIPETAWAAQYMLAPNVGKGTAPPKEALPKGATRWRWSVSRQAWYPTSGTKETRFDKFMKWTKGRDLSDFMFKDPRDNPRNYERWER